MQPASSIIAKIGGPSKVARIVGVHRVRVSNWSRPKASGGTGGTIPQRHILALLDYAKANDLDLTANDFLPAPSKEGEAA